jgi:hypothetical protein
MDTLKYILKNHKIVLPSVCGECPFCQDTLDNSETQVWWIYCKLLERNQMKSWPKCTKEEWIKEIEYELESN